MATDLIFRAGLVARTSPVDLVFGADLSGVTTAFGLALPAPTAAFAVELQAEPVSFAVSLAGPSAAFVAQYDANMPAYMERRASASWRDGDRRAARASTAWRDGAGMLARVSFSWRDGDRRSGRASTAWRDGAGMLTRASFSWRDGDRRSARASTAWRDGAAARVEAFTTWREAARLRIERSGGWRDGAPLRSARGVSWRDGRASLLLRPSTWGLGSDLPVTRVAAWRDGTRLTSRGLAPFPPVVRPPYDPCYLPPRGTAVDLVFAKEWATGNGLLFICGRHPAPTASVVVPIRKVYVVINNTHLIKLDGMVELALVSMQITLDAESWTWGFSATLRADQLPLVTPAGDGTPVLLAAVINGASYYMVAESIKRDRRFNQASIRVSGRGKNALLDAPYAVTQSFGNTSARTAAQLLDAALTLNGTAIGWTVESSLTDWLVPAGAWSHVGSHMSAALSVAGAAGGYIQPHPTADTLRVLPRYPAAPWDWGSVTPDFELPASVAQQEGISWVEKARYNRVFVSGAGQGVLCQVTRAGTAGDVVAPMVTDPLITQAAAGRQLGLNVLADTGRIATVTLGLPVLAETGVISPGKFVRYVDGATTRLGLVRSTAVDVAFPEVWQTLAVQTHE